MFRLAIATAIIVCASPAVATDIVVEPRTKVASGSEPGIAITGLSYRQRVRIHAFASFGRWIDGGGGRYKEVVDTYHSWADVTADRQGRVAMDRANVRNGTYAGVDGYGLLWSMRKPRDPILANAAPTGSDAPRPAKGTTSLLVTAAGKIIGSGKVEYREPPGLSVKIVTEGRLNGAYAAPADKRRRPVIILLHGSEGGGAEEARSLAVRYAGQGFAAFALNYFAWDLKKLDGPPNHHVNQPIELIAEVRDWLARQPEADVTRLALYGHSKGAEYATIAATYYPWIKAVVACVPTDVIWEGYGIGDGRNRPDPKITWPELRSSWSWRGAPLPYVPLRPWSDPSRAPWFNNTERYDVSRAEHPHQAKAAAIPIDRAAARFLLLGGDRDEVWSSGRMARALKQRMQRAGKGDRVELVTYGSAGHQICGDGTYPTHIWADASPDPRVKDPIAEGAAAADALRRIKRFLKARL